MMEQDPLLCRHCRAVRPVWAERQWRDLPRSRSCIVASRPCGGGGDGLSRLRRKTSFHSLQEQQESSLVVEERTIRRHRGKPMVDPGDIGSDAAGLRDCHNYCDFMRTDGDPLLTTSPVSRRPARL